MFRTTSCTAFTAAGTKPVRNAFPDCRSTEVQQGTELDQTCRASLSRQNPRCRDVFLDGNRSIKPRTQCLSVCTKNSLKNLNLKVFFNLALQSMKATKMVKKDDESISPVRGNLAE